MDKQHLAGCKRTGDFKTLGLSVDIQQCYVPQTAAIIFILLQDIPCTSVSYSLQKFITYNANTLQCVVSRPVIFPLELHHMDFIKNFSLPCAKLV